MTDRSAEGILFENVGEWGQKPEKKDSQFRKKSGGTKSFEFFLF
jgi:hypothetical protein